jgi:hypothetical protein
MVVTLNLNYVVQIDQIFKHYNKTVQDNCFLIAYLVYVTMTGRVFEESGLKE